jgi:hypothetical protein
MEYNLHSVTTFLKAFLWTDKLGICFLFATYNELGGLAILKDIYKIDLIFVYINIKKYYQ